MRITTLQLCFCVFIWTEIYQKCSCGQEFFLRGKNPIFCTQEKRKERGDGRSERDGKSGTLTCDPKSFSTNICCYLRSGLQRNISDGTSPDGKPAQNKNVKSMSWFFFIWKNSCDQRSPLSICPFHDSIISVIKYII